MPNDSTMRDLLEHWKHWSLSADRHSDGWESDFPDWAALIDAAEATLLGGASSSAVLSALAECFALAQEDEELLEFAVRHIDACWPMLQALATSPVAGCRWQVYVAAVAKGAAAEPLLREGLSDPDPYAQRRALLALARLRPTDAEALAERFLGSSEEYLRLAAIDMVAVVPSAPFRRRVLAALLEDESPYVRDAAARELARG